jgi:cytochrome b561
LSAISGAWLEGHPLTLGVLGSVPPLLAKNAPLGHEIADIHGTLGDAILWLAGLHAVAALFHHFVLRDDVLLSMFPARWRSAVRRRA